ncbi:UNKNOWN [Stylonychia lemnae]|uniref:Uncharacterized protein n=1 Tax=Stylonychia lemnae TaxID=5949 RepID=A0A078B9C5_STYLE|nr:UNKNOWN [Stylonychia lemnae]|eukprot:CDW90994.1 UNKNOWN [Stylonychia lemnae]
MKKTEQNQLIQLQNLDKLVIPSILARLELLNGSVISKKQNNKQGKLSQGGVGVNSSQTFLNKDSSMIKNLVQNNTRNQLIQFKQNLPINQHQTSNPSSQNLITIGPNTSFQINKNLQQVATNQDLNQNLLQTPLINSNYPNYGSSSSAYILNAKNSNPYWEKQSRNILNRKSIQNNSISGSLNMNQNGLDQMFQSIQNIQSRRDSSLMNLLPDKISDKLQSNNLYKKQFETLSNIYGLNQSQKSLNRKKFLNQTQVEASSKRKDQSSNQSRYNSRNNSDSIRSQKNHQIEQSRINDLKNNESQNIYNSYTQYPKFVKISSKNQRKIEISQLQNKLKSKQDTRLKDQQQLNFDMSQFMKSMTISKIHQRKNRGNSTEGSKRFQNQAKLDNRNRQSLESSHSPQQNMLQSFQQRSHSFKIKRYSDNNNLNFIDVPRGQTRKILRNFMSQTQNQTIMPQKFQKDLNTSIKNSGSKLQNRKGIISIQESSHASLQVEFEKIKLQATQQFINLKRGLTDGSDKEKLMNEPTVSSEQLLGKQITDFEQDNNIQQRSVFYQDDLEVESIRSREEIAFGDLSFYEESFRNFIDSKSKPQENIYTNSDLIDNRHRKCESFGVQQHSSERKQREINHKDNSHYGPYEELIQTQIKNSDQSNFNNQNLMTPCFIASPQNLGVIQNALYQDSSKQKQKINLRILGARYNNLESSDRQQIDTEGNESESFQNDLDWHQSEYENMHYRDHNEPERESSLQESSYNNHQESSIIESEDLDYDDQLFKNELRRIKQILMPTYKHVDKKGQIAQKGCQIKGQIINNHNNFNLIYLPNKKADSKKSQNQYQRPEKASSSHQQEDQVPQMPNINNFLAENFQ